MSNFNSMPHTPMESHTFSYHKKKEIFLRYIYYAMCIMALPAIATVLWSAQITLMNGIYLGAYAILLLITFIKMPYWPKAIVLLMITYGFGIRDLLNTGIMGEASIFLLALITLSVLLFSIKIGIISGLISFSTITVVGWLTLTKTIPLNNNPGIPESIFTWIAGSAGLLMISGIIAFGIHSVQTEFLNTLRDEEINLESQNQDRANLEERVQARTQAFDRRSEQLEAAAFVTRAAAETHDLNKLLNIAVQQISTRFGYYHTGIFLADEANLQLSLAAASSKGGQAMLERGHKLEIGREGVVGFAAYQKRSRLAQDVGADAMFFKNPDLPETHSEIALPLLAQNRLIGVLDIQSQKQNAFSPDDIDALQTMADQIAMAIENIRLIERSRLAIVSLENLNAENVSKVWKERLGDHVKGYSYTPLGIKAISEIDHSESNNTDQNSVFPGSAKEKIIKIPLILRGKDIGLISLKRKSNEAAWVETEKEMVQRIANQVALAIENARFLEDSQRQASREQLVNELSSRFSRSLDVDTLLQNAIREVHKLPQVSQVSIFINPAEEIQKSE